MGAGGQREKRERRSKKIRRQGRNWTARNERVTDKQTCHNWFNTFIQVSVAHIARFEHQQRLAQVSEMHRRFAKLSVGLCVCSHACLHVRELMFVYMYVSIKPSIIDDCMFENV